MNMNMKNQQGFVALLIVIIIMSIAATISFSVVFVFLNQIKATKDMSSSYESLYAAESGIEDALFRVGSNKNWSSPYTFQVENASVQVTISSMSGNTRTITAEGESLNNARNIEVEYELTPTGIGFFYGVQVGEGGVIMENNSRIEGAGGAPGNFYSNGPVLGDAGATITGDVTVATGVILDAEHDVYNSDFSFLTTTGSKVTIVDASSNAGTWTSLAVGLDGFARISYIVGTTLNFARCTNHDCTARVITPLETSGGEGIGEQTSIVIGLDGFARISYYQDQSDDLKFIRCLNDDCTAKNTTIVESLNNVGDSNALRLGLDGLPRIAYLYDSSDHLRFARCLDADCTTKNIANVDTSGNVGEPHISLAIGLDGFGRISYYEDSGRNLNFARCTNDDCTTRVITTIDSAGTVGQYTSTAVGSDGFARISYFDGSNSDLKFARCTNDDCTTRVITAVDSSGNVGLWTSLILGSDGFGRISYYDSSNRDLKYARCTNADCSLSVITAVDSSANVGEYTSIGLGQDGFGRISYYDSTNRDLKYVRCIDADCTSGILPGDAAQSFIPSQSQPLAKVSLYLKKGGNPSTATVRINADSGGSPATASLSSTSLDSNLVTASYGWIEVTFSSPANLIAGTTYWLVLDANQDVSNNYMWGYDNTGGYANGVAKYSEDWNSKPWFLLDGDFNFRTYLGTGLSTLQDVVVYGTARANSIITSEICGDAYYQSIDASSLDFVNNPTNPTCGGNPLTSGIPFSGQPDPPVAPMPISQANIDEWKNDAAAGGTIIGDYNVTSDVSLGPKEITGDLNITSNNNTLTIMGTIYVNGNIDISNGSTIRCDASYGQHSCIVIADGWVHISNNGIFSGSGQAGSYVMLLSTLQGCNGSGGVSCTHHDAGMDLHNNALGAIFYATDSMIFLHNGANVSEITAYKLNLEQNAVVTYESGLANAQFLSGPSAGWEVNDWKEIP